MKAKPANRELLGTVVASTLSRSVLNTSRRFIYPFAPVISRGLGVPLTAVTSVIAVNQATSIVALFASHMGDRAGYRRMMVYGLVMLIAGMAVAGTFPFYYTLVAAMFLSGLGKNLFDPAIQAYVSARVSYQRRGLVIGIMEISWSAATLVGIPAIGVLMERFGWRSPFFAIAGAGVLSLLLVLIYIKDDAEENRKQQNHGNVSTAVKTLLRNRKALGAVGFGFFISFANDNLFVVYGAWLEEFFSLGVVAIGLGTSVIGAAELAGEFSTAALSDRLGLHRSVTAGVMLSTLAYLVLPLTEHSLLAALPGLFAVFLFFEFSFVTSLSLCTELVPGLRATMMSLFFVSAGLGRVAGAFTGGVVWRDFGMEGVCWVSAVLNLVAVFSLYQGLKQQKVTEG